MAEEADYKLSLTNYGQAFTAVQEATNAFSKGTGDKTAWYDKLDALGDAQDTMFSTMILFTRTANQLNRLSGCGVTRHTGWLTNGLMPVYTIYTQQLQQRAQQQAAQRNINLAEAAAQQNASVQQSAPAAPASGGQPSAELQQQAAAAAAQYAQGVYGKAIEEGIDPDGAMALANQALQEAYNKYIQTGGVP